MFTGDFQIAEPQIMPSGDQVTRYTARFKSWSGPDVEDTWNGKATLDFNGEPQWGEFAVLLSLANGWNGYAVEVYNGLHFWKTSPFHPPDRRLTLEPPEKFRAFLDNAAMENGNNQRPNFAGCWDLLAWKGDEFRFIEVKRYRKDKFRDTQYKWFESARRAGIPVNSFVVVEWVIEPEPHPQLIIGTIPVMGGTSVKSHLNERLVKSGGSIQVKNAVTSGKWNESSFFQDLSNRTNPDTVNIARELFTWSLQNAEKMDWGSGKAFGTFIPRFKYRMLKFSFFNVESRGYLWMSLSPHRFFKNETNRKELLSLLSGMPVLRVDPSTAIMQTWFTIDLKQIRTQEQKDQLLTMMGWILGKITNNS